MSEIEAKLRARNLELPPAVVPPAGVVLPFQFVRIVDGAHTFRVTGRRKPTARSHNRSASSVGSSRWSRGIVRRGSRRWRCSAACSARSAISIACRAWLRVFGMVNSAPGFHRQPSVINGFSDLILELYGPERGAHARSAVGMAELPFDLPVEIEAEVEIDPA